MKRNSVNKKKEKKIIMIYKNTLDVFRDWGFICPGKNSRKKKGRAKKYKKNMT